MSHSLAAGVGLGMKPVASDAKGALFMKQLLYSKPFSLTQALRVFK